MSKCKCSDQVHHEKLKSHGINNGYTNHRCRCDKCVEAHRIYKRIYDRRRQANNPAYREKTREQGRRYRAEHREDVLRHHRECYQRNKDYIKRQRKKYYDKRVNAVPNPRRGKWSAAEDRVLLNLPPEVGDLEAAFILQRTWQSVVHRRNVLLYPPKMCHCGEQRVPGRQFCREHDREYRRKRYAARKAQQTTES